MATNVGGIPSFVADKVTGLLVDPGRPDQLADAIEDYRRALAIKPAYDDAETNLGVALAQHAG